MASMVWSPELGEMVPTVMQEATVTRAARPTNNITLAMQTSRTNLSRQTELPAGYQPLGAGALPTGTFFGSGVNVGGSQPTGQLQGLLEGAGVGGATAKGLSALGLGGSAAAAAGIAAGGYSLLGGKWPWETAGGQGFIAPWTSKEYVEGVGWVATEGGQAVQGAAMAAGAKNWSNGLAMYSMAPDGWVYVTSNKTGRVTRYKPRAPIVLSRKGNWKSIGKATRYMKRHAKTARKLLSALGQGGRRKAATKFIETGAGHLIKA